MKKMSLKRILEDLGTDLNDYFKKIKGEVEASPSPSNDVWWKNDNLPDDPSQGPQNPQELFGQYRINQSDMDGWINRVSKQGFTPELYKEISKKVGDMDNFMLDVQEVMPQVYSSFEAGGLANAIPQLSTNPDVAKNLGKQGQVPAELQNKMNQAGQASWEELADQGREIQYPDPQKRAYQKWREQNDQANQLGQTPPPPPSDMFADPSSNSLSLQQAASQTRTRPNVRKQSAPQQNMATDAATNPVKRIRK